MNLYAIRDRLLNYFMQPFLGPTDNQVLASLAEVINNEESKHAFAKTPHHFEVWVLATVHEDGTVIPNKEFLADAASLIRTSVRQTGEPGGNTHQGAIRGRQEAPRGAPSPEGANGSVAPYTAPPEGEQAAEVRGRPEGVPRQPNG